MKKWSNNYVITLILLLLCVFIKLFSLNEQPVEKLYSRGFYPVIAAVMRKLFGWIPFSFGDVLYGLVFLSIVFLVAKFIYKLVFRKWRRPAKQILYKKANGLFQLFLILYLLFNILWGLNYNRFTVDQQLGISIKDTSIIDLKKLNLWLLQKVNHTKQLSIKEKFEVQDFNFLKTESRLAYQSLSENSNIANMGNFSVKPTLYSWVASSSGYTGYYNPFTGEAQVNDNNPFYELPFVVCHEMAHQLGYAKEDEANFIGFLACMQSKNYLFQYSAYKAMLGYALSDIATADIRFTMSIYDSLSIDVRQDILFSRRFRSKNARLLQPFMMGIYEKYLLSNEQPLGLLSYNGVTGLMIGYFKKNQYQSFY